MNINYTAEPTAAQFHASPKLIRGFMGPVGNGKSVACIMEMLRLAMEQWPNDKGVRKTRWAVVRNTRAELMSTTLNTWKQWVPERISPVVMNPIITTKLIQPIKSDGTTLQMEVYFLGLDKPKDVKKLLGIELSGVFLNEARELPFAVVKSARERLGRYPADIDGYTDVYENGKLIYNAPKEKDSQGNDLFDEDGEPIYKPCRRKVMLMDTNPPDEDSWWYQLAEEGCLRKAEHKQEARKETAEIFDFFRGPAPLIDNGDGTYSNNPKAENIRHLDGGYQYYRDMIAGNDEDQINVQVLGNYGTIKDGKPVYPSFNDRIHVAEKHFLPIEGLPICLGWDFGLTPCVVIGQLTSTGQARIICELLSEDMDVRQFARDVVKPFLQTKFSHCEIGFSLADPSGNIRGEGEGKSAIGILNDDYIVPGVNDLDRLDMGFSTEPAPTNDITRRLDAVKSFLNKLVGHGEPGFVIDKRCEYSRKGFNGQYCYKRISVGGSEERFRDVPDKGGPWSEPQDCIQYLCLGFAGGYVVDSSLESDYDEYDDRHTGTGYW